LRIAILTPSFFTFSGVDRVAERQAKEFAQNGNEVVIFTLKANMEPPLNVEMKIIGMPERFLSQRIYRLMLPLDFIKVRKWVPKLKDFDVIYSHLYPMNWLAYQAKKRYGIRYIYYNYGYAPPSTFSNLIERVYMKAIITMANWTIKKADGAISISQYLQKDLKHETGLDSEVVYCKIDTGRFYPGVDGTAVRSQYNLSGAPMVLFVGRISPHKGIHLLINAFNMVKQQIAQAKLIIIGKHSLKSYSNKLRQMSDASIIFVEDVSDQNLPMYYAACDVYATATLWEGFDLPVAEAQACGKPVVAFDIGPHPEVINIGDEGKLVPVGDTAAMAEAIRSFLKVKSGVKP